MKKTLFLIISLLFVSFIANAQVTIKLNSQGYNYYKSYQNASNSNFTNKSQWITLTDNDINIPSLGKFRIIKVSDYKDANGHPVYNFVTTDSRNRPCNISLFFNYDRRYLKVKYEQEEYLFMMEVNDSVRVYK